MSKISYGACPHCAARNIDCRAHCWRCGATLASFDRREDQVDSAQIQALLAQAQVADFSVKARAERSWRWPWQARPVSNA